MTYGNDINGKRSDRFSKQAANNLFDAMALSRTRPREQADILPTKWASVPPHFLSRLKDVFFLIMIQDGREESLCRGRPRFHTGIGEYVSRSLALQVLPQQHHIRFKVHQTITDADTFFLF
jgi:hypothetical protein